MTLPSIGDVLTVDRLPVALVFILQVGDCVQSTVINRDQP